MRLGVFDVISCVEIILYPCPTRVEIEFSCMENLLGGLALCETGHGLPCPDHARKAPRDIESLENGIRRQKTHLSPTPFCPKTLTHRTVSVLSFFPSFLYANHRPHVHTPTRPHVRISQLPPSLSQNTLLPFCNIRPRHRPCSALLFILNPPDPRSPRRVHSPHRVFNARASQDHAMQDEREIFQVPGVCVSGP